MGETRSSRRRFQFSLRALLVVVTLAAVGSLVAQKLYHAPDPVREVLERHNAFLDLIDAGQPAAASQMLTPDFQQQHPWGISSLRPSQGHLPIVPSRDVVTGPYWAKISYRPLGHPDAESLRFTWIKIEDEWFLQDYCAFPW